MAGGLDMQGARCLARRFLCLAEATAQRAQSNRRDALCQGAGELLGERPHLRRQAGVWHDLLAEGVSCGLHRIERLMRSQGLKARPRRRRLPPDLGERQAAAVAPNVLDRALAAPAPNRRWIADFTYVWTAEG